MTSFALGDTVWPANDQIKKIAGASSFNPSSIVQNHRPVLNFKTSVFAVTIDVPFLAPNKFHAFSTFLDFTMCYNKQCKPSCCKTLAEIDPDYSHEEEISVGAAYGAPKSIEIER